MPMPDEDPSGAPLLPRPRQEGYHPKGLRPIIPRTPLIPLDPADSVPAHLLPAEEKRSSSGISAPVSAAESPSNTIGQALPTPVNAFVAEHLCSSSLPEPAASTLSTGLLPSAKLLEAAPPIEGDKTTRLHERPVPPSVAPPVRSANERRPSPALKLFGLSLFITAASFAAFATLLYSFFEHNIEPRLGTGFAVSPPRPGEPPPPAPVPDELKAAFATTTTQLAAYKDQISQLQKRIATDKDQIDRLQTQMEALRSQQSEAGTQIKTLDARLLEAQLAASAPRPSDLASNVQITTDAEHATPDGISMLQELRLLKERNRLTFYADQALANASSKAMASLWNAVRDPELVFVKDGAVAEIIRVQHFYGMLPGLPPSYRLPVRELFHDDAIHTDADLNDDQVTKLLRDETQPLEVRTRAAMLLSGRRDNKVGNALVEAMRHDPNLNVVKAAQHTLQENYELYAPRLFDSVGMAAVWKERLAKLTNPVPPEIQVRPPKD